MSRGTDIPSDAVYQGAQIKVYELLGKAISNPSLRDSTILEIQHAIFLAVQQGKALGYRDGYHDCLMERHRLVESLADAKLRVAQSKSDLAPKFDPLGTLEKQGFQGG